MERYNQILRGDGDDSSGTVERTKLGMYQVDGCMSSDFG